MWKGVGWVWTIFSSFSRERGSPFSVMRSSVRRSVAGAPKRVHTETRAEPAARADLPDDAPAHEDVTLVEDCPLAQGDGALRLVEHHAGAASRPGRDHGRSRGIAIAYLHVQAKRGPGLLHARPIEIVRCKLPRVELGVRAGNHRVGGRIDARHVQRVSASDTKPLALAHGVLPDTGVGSQDPALRVLDRAFLFRSVHDRLVAPRGKVLTFRPVVVCQPGFPGTL